MKRHLNSYRPWKIALFLGAALSATLAPAQTTISQKVQADTYFSSGQPAVNFGTMGAMMIAAPTIAQPRTEESLIRFDTAEIKSALDANYGAGDWTITAVTLSLLSNVSTAGQQPGNSSFNKIAAGGFELDWLSNDNWNEATMTWNTLPTVLPGSGGNTLASVGSYFWAADGSSSQTWSLNLESELVSDIANGGKVTLLGQPTGGSTVGYLFNTLSSNPAYLNVTADRTAAVPEPSTMAMALVVSGLAGFVAVRGRKNAR